MEDPTQTAILAELKRKRERDEAEDARKVRDGKILWISIIALLGPFVVGLLWFMIHMGIAMNSY